MMKRLTTILIFCISIFCYSQDTNKEWKGKLQHGDLIFNIHTQGSAFGDAIVNATKGKEGASISHVAIFMADSLGGRVIEATGKYGVRICPLDSFITKSEHSANGEPLLLFGRLKDRSCVNAAVERAKKYLGRPYDWLFSDTEDAIYCSELVHFSYIDAEGNYIFPQQPMSFHDTSGTILPYWIDYYAKRGLKVPEGEPGTNPKGISNSDKITLFQLTINN